MRHELEQDGRASAKLQLTMMRVRGAVVEHGSCAGDDAQPRQTQVEHERRMP